MHCMAAHLETGAACSGAAAPARTPEWLHLHPPRWPDPVCLSARRMHMQRAHRAPGRRHRRRQAHCCADCRPQQLALMVKAAQIVDCSSAARGLQAEPHWFSLGGARQALLRADALLLLQYVTLCTSEITKSPHVWQCEHGELDCVACSAIVCLFSLRRAVHTAPAITAGAKIIMLACKTASVL